MLSYQRVSPLARLKLCIIIFPWNPTILDGFSTAMNVVPSGLKGVPLQLFGAKAMYLKHARSSKWLTINGGYEKAEPLKKVADWVFHRNLIIIYPLVIQAGKWTRTILWETSILSDTCCWSSPFAILIWITPLMIIGFLFFHKGTL